MSRTQRLAEAILADRQREAAAHNIVACFVCGRTFMYRGRRGDLNGRLCSLRCHDRYDAGNEPIGEEIVYRWRDGRPMKKGSKGFYIDCAHCRKEFESFGLRCCSLECDRAYSEREHNLAVMAEAGIEPATKRQCEVCSATIPKWRNGRIVSRKTRFAPEMPKTSR